MAKLELSASEHRMLVWLAGDGIIEAREYAVRSWRDELMKLEPVVDGLRTGEMLDLSDVSIAALKIAVNLGRDKNSRHLANERMADDVPSVDSLLAI